MAIFVEGVTSTYSRWVLDMVVWALLCCLLGVMLDVLEAQFFVEEQ